MIDIVWDMETGDPDDLFTLLLLLGHPDVNLKAITVTPGTPDQVGLVRHMVSLFDRKIPIGSFDLDRGKSSVHQWYYDVYGDIPPSRDAEVGSQVLLQFCDDQTTLLTGAPLKNLGAAIALSEGRTSGHFHVGRWIAQGGFAGEGVVPREKQLPQFEGLTTCPTYNLNGDHRSALAALVYPHMKIKRFVSKNVCHSVFYDAELHDLFSSLKDQSQSLALIWKGMDAYLKKFPNGKKFHDPLAACCAIDESIGEWVEVELFRAKGEWGSRLAPGSGTWIIIDYDHEKFVHTLTCRY